MSSDGDPLKADFIVQHARADGVFTEMMLTELIPMVERTFRVAPGRENRAMAGLSMGGAQTVGTVLADLDKFAYLGGFSGSSGGRGGFDPKTSNGGVFADAAAFNKKVKVLFLGIGSAEGPGTKTFSDHIDSGRHQNIYYESPGTAHEWLTWRRCFREFVAAVIPMTRTNRGLAMTSLLRQLFVISGMAIAALTLAAVAGVAQEPGARRGDPPVVSPDVAADRRVTFRLRAPEAKTVRVSGDFGTDVELRQSGEGVWSATVGPLDPEMYVYYFTVDGVRLPDPSNPQVKIGYVTSTTTSLLTVPGDGPAFYDVQDVPHGEIRTLLYKSRSNAVTRELTVYLPPGYDEARNRRYPVLYLLHGFANDHHSWHRYGRANDILDNLLAQKSIQPFLVVMPLGYGGAQINGDGTGIPPKGAGTFGGDAALYERDLLEDIIPMIDRKYRTIADRKSRAIVGFSMGGGQAGRFGLRHLDTFSQVGIMSAGMAGGPDTEPLATLAANREKTNKQIDLLWIACGKDDGAMKGAKTLHHALEQAGIEHTFLETEGAHHWRVWRRYLRDLAPLLFK